MDKLQRIIECMSNDMMPSWNDVVWLIEQAEKVEDLQEELSLLCPIGDLPIIESLKTEKLMYMEEIAGKENEIQKLHGKLNIVKDVLNSI